MATQIIFGRLLPKTLTSLTSFRALSTRATIPSLVERNSSALKLRNGHDYFRTDVIMEKRYDLKQTRVQIIHDYVKALADLVGSEEEARMMVYSDQIDNEHYNSFGTLISNELYPRVEVLPGVSFIFRMDFPVNSEPIGKILSRHPFDLDLVEEEYSKREEFKRFLLTKQGIFAA